jgi:hypothetical protein
MQFVLTTSMNKQRHGSHGYRILTQFKCFGIVLRIEERSLLLVSHKRARALKLMFQRRTLPELDLSSKDATCTGLWLLPSLAIRGDTTRIIPGGGPYRPRLQQVAMAACYYSISLLFLFCELAFHTKFLFPSSN